MALQSNQPSASGLHETKPYRSVHLQFAVRHLLLLMLVCSFLSAVLFAFPNWLASATVIVASILLLAATTTILVYVPGYFRVFCIGALFPIALVAVSVGCLFVVITFEAFGDDYDRILDVLDDAASGLRFAILFG